MLTTPCVLVNWIIELAHIIITMEIKKKDILYKDGTKKLLSIGSTCVIFKADKILLVRGRGGNKFKFPGGHIDDEETIRDSAIREAKEEIGVDVQILGEPFFYLFEFDENTDIILANYKAEIVNGEPEPTTEIEEIGWFEIDNLPEVFDNVRPVIELFRR